jgi:glucokinase
MRMQDVWVVGVDVGGTEIKAGLVDGRGRIRARRAVHSDSTGLRGFRQNLDNLLKDLRKEMPQSCRAAAIGIGCKGIIDTASCRVRILPGPFGFLENQPMDEWARSGFGAAIPVAMNNDAKVALVGEQRWGAARRRSDIVLLTLGTGVGGAILSGGQILPGSMNAAGHLGHIAVDFKGPECYCGNTGCVEAIFSARAIEGDALAALRRGCESTLASFTADPRSLTCLDVFKAAGKGDRVARSIIHRAVSALAAAMAGMAHALDPELFVLGGQIAEAGDALFVPLRKELHRRTAGISGRKIPVRKTALGEAMGVLGAAALAWKVANGVQ